MKRVVITGMGCITPIGNNPMEFWSAMMEAKSGADKITLFNPEGFTTQFACEVKNFDPVQHFGVKDARKLDRYTQFAILASEQAIAQSGFTQYSDINLERAGVIIGSGIGGMNTFEEEHRSLLEKGPRRVSPHFIPMMILDIAAGHVSMKHGLKGPNFATCSACATGSHAIGTAMMMLQLDQADVIVAGGAEATVCPMAIAGFNSVRALSQRNESPKTASRPFDRDRDGFVLGEGSGILVLETLDHALKRGAPILAEISSYGFSGDAYHVTAPAPEGEGAIRSMKQALRNAKLNPADIDYINAHGTSTDLNDMNESIAIKNVFAEHAYRLNVSSTKSMTGHLLGAAGAIESVACILAIQNQTCPPTINLENPGDGLDLNYTAKTAQKRRIKHVLNNVFGFGGHNASLIFSQFET